MADKETFKVTERTAKYRTEIQQVGNSVLNDSFLVSYPSRKTPGEDEPHKHSGEYNAGDDRNNRETRRPASDVDHAAEASEDDRAYSLPRDPPQEEPAIDSNARSIVNWLHRTHNGPVVSTDELARLEYDEALADLKETLGNTDSDLASTPEDIDDSKNKGNAGVSTAWNNKPTANEAQAIEKPRLPGLYYLSKAFEEREGTTNPVEPTTSGPVAILSGLSLHQQSHGNNDVDRSGEETINDDRPGTISDDARPATMQDLFADFYIFLKQMMFVSGETGEPSPETTTMIEGIVQQQVIEIVSHHYDSLSRSQAFVH